MNKNHFRLSVPVVCLALLILIGCSDAQATKVRHVEQGDAYMAQGKYAEAVLEYRNAVRIDARFGEARYKLAKAYQRVENLRQAVREYLAAAELLPDRPDAQLDAAILLLSGGDFDGARKYAEAALKLDAKNLDAQLTLAQALSGLKDTEAAIRELEEAMKLAPGDSRPLAALGTVEAGRGNPAAAEAAFRRALVARCWWTRASRRAAAWKRDGGSPRSAWADWVRSHSRRAMAKSADSRRYTCTAPTR